MHSGNIYDALAKYTDAFYEAKDYHSEVDFILFLLKKHKITGITVIDVPCGGGRRAQIFHRLGYAVHAVDLSESMLRQAKKNAPGVQFHQQDMRELDLAVKADVLITMCNSINNNLGYKQLRSTLQKFYDHLVDHGLLVFDTIFTQEGWIEGKLAAQEIRTAEFDIARIMKSRTKGSVATIDSTYVIYEHGRKKIAESMNEFFLLDPQKVKMMMEGIGFSTKIYYDFSRVKKTGTSLVFVGLKY
jgi:SAM-dependent methyltransferase